MSSWNICWKTYVFSHLLTIFFLQIPRQILSVVVHFFFREIRDDMVDNLDFMNNHPCQKKIFSRHHNFFEKNSLTTLTTPDKYYIFFFRDIRDIIVDNLDFMNNHPCQKKINIRNTISFISYNLLNDTRYPTCIFHHLGRDLFQHVLLVHSALAFGTQSP